MPSIRIGFSTDFNLLNEQVGIGTTLPTARLDVAGQIRADNTTGSGGVSTITRYDGFSNSSQTLGNTVSIAETSKGNLNSISGEIIIADGKTITVTDGVSLAAGRLDSLTVLKTFDLPSGGTSGRIATPEKGSTRYNEDLGQLEFYTGYEWRTVGSYDGSGRGRGVWAGGEPTTSTTIDYINISSTGNALNFGVLTSVRGGPGGCASNIRGLIGAGYAPSLAGSNIIEYITIASEGNSIDFGDLTVIRGDTSSCSSSTRGVWGGGYSNSPTTTFINVIDYVQISTIGNALDFGDLSVGRYYLGATSSPTRGVFVGGSSPTTTPSNQSLIDFITIASTGNAVNFGNLTERRSGSSGAVSNSVRGIFAGGVNSPVIFNTIDYITTASTGNAQDFGDLTSGKSSVSGVSNSVRGVFGGGVNVFPTRTNFIDYVTIMSTGNAQDFGDLTNNRSFMAAMSDSHGGLGGF